MLFISIFALNAFGEGIPFPEAIVGFLIHLIPTYIVIAVLLIARTWPMPGSIAFISRSVLSDSGRKYAPDSIPVHHGLSCIDRFSLYSFIFYD